MKNLSVSAIPLILLGTIVSVLFAGTLWNTENNWMFSILILIFVTTPLISWCEVIYVNDIKFEPYRGFKNWRLKRLILKQKIIKIIFIFLIISAAFTLIFKIFFWTIIFIIFAKSTYLIYQEIEDIKKQFKSR